MVLIVVSVVTFAALNIRGGSRPLAGAQSIVSGIPCDQLEHTQVHYHAALQIVYRGNLVGIPTSVGRSAFCYYWLHMHTGESGIIHVEAPADRTFTLGDFFAVWSAWGAKAQPLDTTHVSSFTLGPDQKLMVYLDSASGGGPQLFTGDPNTIILEDHEVITLEISPPAVVPPPAFVWPAGF